MLGLSPSLGLASGLLGMWGPAPAGLGCRQPVCLSWLLPGPRARRAPPAGQLGARSDPGHSQSCVSIRDTSGLFS